jgi:hypothetical protein
MIAGAYPVFRKSSRDFRQIPAAQFCAGTRATVEKKPAYAGFFMHQIMPFG